MSDGSQVGPTAISVLRRISHLPVTIFICTAIVIALVSIIEGSPFGRIIRMIREGDRLPEALSKNVLLFKMETMAIGGAVGGLAGAFYALMQGYMSPDDAKPIETFIVWAMVVLGDRGNIWGIVAGTVLVETMYAGTRFLTNVIDVDADILAALRLALIGTLIMVVVSDYVKGPMAYGAMSGSMASPWSPGTAFSKFYHSATELGGQFGRWAIVEGGMGTVTEAL